jgi:hypothetical protein
MMVHMQRFDVDPRTRKATKIRDRMTFGVKLNMHRHTSERATDEHASDQTPTKMQTEDECDYELAGVIVHCSARDDCEVSGGHYIVIIRDAQDGWYECNDKAIFRFYPDDKRNGLDARCFGGKDKKEHATILLYRRCTSPSKTYSSVHRRAFADSSMSSGEDADNHNMTNAPRHRFEDALEEEVGAQTLTFFDAATIAPMWRIFTEINNVRMMWSDEFKNAIRASILFFIHVVIPNCNEQQVQKWKDWIAVHYRWHCMYFRTFKGELIAWLDDIRQRHQDPKRIELER